MTVDVHDWKGYDHKPRAKLKDRQPYWICKKCGAIVSGYDPSGIWNKTPPGPRAKAIAPGIPSSYPLIKMTCDEIRVSQVMES